MSRVALYARYSSDQQREASIEDQFRLCRLYAEKQGWTIVETHQDRAVSGTSLIRPGIQALSAPRTCRRCWASRARLGRGVSCHACARLFGGR